MDKVYKTAIYLRLSKDDEGDKESGSISNQRAMLMAFLDERKDLQYAAEFADDGYSGYDFERPQFQKMLEAAKQGKIDCIVVKDFSRLGRNFLKTEEYMQRIFPKLGVRLISVNDCYDSSRESSSGEYISKPIINLMNEYHVMETSQKVRSVLEHHRRSGKFIGNHTVYGYVIKDKQLEIDDEAARIVRRIFNMKVSGISNQGIADNLNDNNISSPLEHKLKNGISVTGAHLKEGKKALWSSASVKRVLENPIYIGTLVQGKTASLSYRDKRRFKKEPSEMAVFEYAHEPIVSETVFFIVQDLLQRDGYSRLNKESYLFTSFAFCKGCGKPLYHRQDKGVPIIYWMCRNKDCKSKGAIREDKLIESVRETLKRHMEIILDHSEPVTASGSLPDTSLVDLEQTELEKQIEQLKHSKQCLNEQRELGTISENDFVDMNQFYDNKIAKVEFEITEIRNKKQRLLDCIDEIVSRYREYSEMKELTRSIIVTFIDKIEVIDKNNICIHFRYADLFNTDGTVI